MTCPAYLNGRPLLRPLGGVRRYAEQVATRLVDCTVVRPRSARFPWSARVWEQTVLPARTRDGVLLNVGHGAPLAHPRSVVVVHDLFALEDPGSVRRSFAALMSRQLPAIVGRAAAVVTVSSAVADQVAERLGVNRGAITIAPPGIADVFTPGERQTARNQLGLDPDRPVVSALLDPAPRKQASRAVQVLADIVAARPDVHVVVAARRSPGPFAPPAAGVVPAAVTSLDQPSDDTLAALYRASDVVLSTSPAEGFGLAPVEAAACGAAVVARAVPSISEFAPDAAIVVPLGDMCSQVVALLEAPDRCRAQGSRACAAISDLKWERTTATLRTVLTQVEGRCS